MGNGIARGRICLFLKRVSVFPHVLVQYGCYASASEGGHETLQGDDFRKLCAMVIRREGFATRQGGAVHRLLTEAAWLLLDLLSWIH